MPLIYLRASYLSRIEPANIVQYIGCISNATQWQTNIAIVRKKSPIRVVLNILWVTESGESNYRPFLPERCIFAKTHNKYSVQGINSPPEAHVLTVRINGTNQLTQRPNQHPLSLEKESIHFPFHLFLSGQQSLFLHKQYLTLPLWLHICSRQTTRFPKSIYKI